MKDKSKKSGITLVELLIVVALTGLIFALGIHPMISQLKLIDAQRSEINLFDEANLVVSYVTRDAKMASRYAPGATYIIVDLGTGQQRTFTGAAFTIPVPLSNPTTYRTVVYRPDLINATKLVRIDNGVASFICYRMDTTFPYTFTLNPDGTNPPQNNRLRCSFFFQDPDRQELTTQRDFEVMLQGRDSAR